MRARAARAPLRLGLLGCGRIASDHLRALGRIDGVRVVAAADPDANARAAAVVRGLNVMESADELLARPDIDAVLIAAPTGLHAALAIASAQAGKHLYVEKPLATTLEDGVAVVEAVTRSEVVGAIGFNRRFHPLSRQARAVVRAHRIGRVRVVHSAFCEPLDLATLPDWRGSRSSGGGVLLDLASHHFDLLRWLLDTELVPVSACVRSERLEQDGASVVLETSDGATVHGTYAHDGQADFVELLGERGSLRLDRHRSALDLRVRRRRGYGLRPSVLRPSREVVSWRGRRIVRRGVDPSYESALRAFVRQIGTGEQLVATPTDGLRSLEAVLAAERLAQRAA